MICNIYLHLKRRVMKEKVKKNENEKIKSLNPKKESLTIEKLKELTGWDTITDEQAQEIIFSIKSLVSIIIDHQYDQEQKEINDIEYNLKQAA